MLNFGEEEVVTFVVEVGHVVGALEVKAPETLESHIHAAMEKRIVNRDSVTATDFFYDMHRLSVHGLRNVPRGYKTDYGGGVLLFQTFA